jgi:hypothetical protein
MNQIGALTQFISDLNSLRIPYMITGAYAVSYFGLPRATHDLDIVVEIKSVDIDKICRKFAKGYIIDEAMIENAVQYCTHFTIIHDKSDLKIDFWVLKETISEKKKFTRRKEVSLFGAPTFIISAEDMVLTKLEWFKRSKNTKHLDDVVGIIRVRAGKLNKAYIMGALEKLGIKKYWDVAVEKSKV